MNTTEIKIKYPSHDEKSEISIPPSILISPLARDRSMTVFMRIKGRHYVFIMSPSEADVNYKVQLSQGHYHSRRSDFQPIYRAAQVPIIGNFPCPSALMLLVPNSRNPALGDIQTSLFCISPGRSTCYRPGLIP